MSLRLMLAEDHEMVRRAFVQYIGMNPNFDVVAEAATGMELLEKLDAIEIDVLLLDYSIPGSNGTELIERVRKSFPNLPVLILSAYDDGAIIANVMRAGASGYVNKRSPPEELFKAIEQVAATGSFWPPELKARIAHSQNEGEQELRRILSEREYQVCRRLVAGQSIGEIATELGIHSKTGSAHKANLLHKLKLKGVAELVKYCIDHKITF